MTLEELAKMIWSGPNWRQGDELGGYDSTENSWVELQFPRPLGWRDIAEQRFDKLVDQLFEAEKRRGSLRFLTWGIGWCCINAGR